MDAGSFYSNLCKLTSKLSLGAGLCNKRYYECHEVICDEATNLSSKMEVLTSECVASHCEEDFSNQLSEDGIPNVDVSYDGT